MTFGICSRPRHARHDAHAFAASGLADFLADFPTVAIWSYVGVDGIDTRTSNVSRAATSTPAQVEFDTALSKTRATVNAPSLISRPGKCSAKRVAAIVQDLRKLPIVNADRVVRRD